MSEEKSWQESLPENIRDWDEVKNSDTPEKFYEQMANMRSLLGKSIRVPSEEAGDETWSEFYTKLQNKAPDLMRKPDVDNDDAMHDHFTSLGKPDLPSKYDIPELDGYSVPEDRADELKAMAHKANLTAKQFRTLAADLFGNEATLVKSRDDKLASERNVLENEWGDALEQRTQLALDIAENTGAPDTLLNAIKEGQADTNTMKWLFSLSKQISTEGMNMTPLGDVIDSPVDIQQKIDDIYANPEHPYWHESHPNHSKAVQNMLDMMRKIAS